MTLSFTFPNFWWVPINNNNGNSVLFCLKQYFTYIGKPKILQSDNGTEFNNSIINNFLASNNVEHIFLSPRHPQTKGVVEVVHKEVRNYVLKNLNITEDDNTFKNWILESVSVHNNNVHTVTGFKPVFLIRNTDEEIYNIVINNIKKNYKTVLDEEKDNYILNIGDH